MQSENVKIFELQIYNAKMKWINRLICTCLLGVVELAMIIGILVFLSWMRTPPPDINDTKEILVMIFPTWSTILSLITAALTWQGSRTHQAGKEYQEMKTIMGETKNGKN